MIEWIKTFIVVYETRNFSVAAKRLFISQPTVSMQISKLETHLNIKLFHRKGKQTITPTKEADFLYPKLLQTLEGLSDIFSEVTQKENFKTECTISCSNTVAIYILPKFMPSLIAQFPFVDFSIQMMNSEDVVRAIETHESSIGIYEKPIITNFIQKELLLKDELVLAGNLDSPFWILREEESGIRFFNDIYLKEHHLMPKIIYVNNNEVLLKLLENNIGQSIISKLSISKSIHWQPLENSSNYRSMFIIKNTDSFSKEISDIYHWIIQKMHTPTQ